MFNSDEYYFDVQGSPGLEGTEHIVELVTKIAAGVLVTWFSLYELFDELTEFKTLKKVQKQQGTEAKNG